MIGSRVRRRRAAILASAGALAIGLAGCGDSDAPRVLGGAGLRIVFEGEAAALDSVRIELWQDNEVPAPGCAGRTRAGWASVAQPLCTRGALTIENLLGERVRVEPDLPWRERMPGWDQRDDDGAVVPEGIYPVHWRCIDSASSFVFEGHYFAFRESAAGACRWLLWSASVRPSHDGKRIEIAPFPIGFDALTVDPDSGDAVEVTFANPYVVRVSAPGRGAVEQPVTLALERFAEVRVRF